MNQILSFTKDHDILKEGLYMLSLTHGVTSFDLRFKKPNTTFLTNASIHSIEHLLATVVRNSAEKDNIIYFGPMGCRTGFYFLTVNLSFEKVKKLLIESIEKAVEFKEVPGSEKKQCGNYLEHDLNQAITDLKEFLKVLNTNDK